MSDECTTTRLAPSPTGALHLGNARTFLVNYLMAVRNGWRVLMRVEDLDGPRIKAGASELLLDELRWLGLKWEEPIVHQLQRAHVYKEALGALAKAGIAYPCTCSRKDAAAAGGAPHADDGVEIYPGTCRGRYSTADEAAATGKPVAWRIRVMDEPITFHDQFAGTQSFNLARSCGDFVIFKSDGLAAYQLAVVLDDAAGGVDAIIRGDDLLESAARQIHLRNLLDCASALRGVGKSSMCPRYWHLPLVVGPDGRRLAKRHGDTRLSHYRQFGATARRVLGLLGYWCGVLESRRETDMDELVERFDLARLPKARIVFSHDDDLFLKGQ